MCAIDLSEHSSQWINCLDLEFKNCPHSYLCAATIPDYLAVVFDQVHYDIKHLLDNKPPKVVACALEECKVFGDVCWNQLCYGIISSVSLINVL